MIPAVMPTYARSNVTFAEGAGCYVTDTAGKRYLDFGTGVAVNSLGHCHPHLVKALQDQAGKLWHCSNLYDIPGQQKLAGRLIANTFADTVFFSNSGAEAVECGIKTIRKYHHANGHPEKYRIITCEGAFHGRTLATIAAGGQAKHLEGFGPVVDGFDQVPFGNMNMLRDAITAETAGILIEPVQGEGGIRPFDPEFLQRLRKTADEFGLLLMFDEVQTGVGRTGKFFAHEWSGITPDVMAIAKGIGGGFPTGACLATEKAAAGMTAGTHGSTFGGNPLAMAAANAVLDVVLEDGFFDNVLKQGARLKEGLQNLQADYSDKIKEVRGQGLILGLQCAEEGANGALVGRLIEAGLLTVPAGDNVVRIMPPLIVGEAEIDEALAILRKVLADKQD